MTAAPFTDYLALVDALLARREAIVDLIERRCLNVKGKDVSRSRDRAGLDAAFAAGVFEALPIPLRRLDGALAAARATEGMDPASRQSTHQLSAGDLLVRAYSVWERDRWPGANARRVYAERLFTAFALRQLEDLSLRIWDAGADDPPRALAAIQRRLDGLNRPSLLRDARWLLQTAQGPLTRQLAPYFALANRIASSFAPSDRLEIHRAGALLAGGHLRSQLRYRMGETGLAADDPVVLATTRNSNAMDMALLIGDLTPLLEAYDQACRDGALDRRRTLADAIVQGLSADPELLLTRLDLLGPSTTIEDVFLRVDTGGADGRITTTAAGERHAQALTTYARLIAALAAPLHQDAADADPAGRIYSPLAMTYGFCADLLANMAADALYGPTPSSVSLEEMFASVDGDHARSRVALWQRWRRPEAGAATCELSIEWAEEVFARTRSALAARAASSHANASGVRSARLFLSTADPADAAADRSLPDGIVSAQDQCVTSDVARALAIGATAFPRSQCAADRAEGRFLGSAEIDGKWFGISKAVLTLCVSRGQDALLAGVPRQVCEVVAQTCESLIPDP